MRSARKVGGRPSGGMPAGAKVAANEAKLDVQRLVATHGAHGAIRALSRVLADLGPEWTDGHNAVEGVEVVLGYAPCREDDWREAAKPKAPTTGDEWEYWSIRVPVRCSGRCAGDVCGKAAVVGSHPKGKGAPFFYYCADCDPRKVGAR